MTRKMIGHNDPTKTLEDFLILDADGNSAGRIKLTKYELVDFLKKNYITSEDI